MKQAGLYLLIAGVGTILLNLIGMEFRFLSWIDMWGETVGWAIRVGAIVLGGALWFFGNSSQTTNVTE